MANTARTVNPALYADHFDLFDKTTECRPTANFESAARARREQHRAGCGRLQVDRHLTLPPLNAERMPLMYLRLRYPRRAAQKIEVAALVGLADVL